MRKQLSVLFLSAAVASGVRVFTQSPSQTEQNEAPASSNDFHSASSDNTTLRIAGTIGQYDAAARTLSLATTGGTVQFLVASSVRVSRSGHRIEASELKKLTGYRAAVRYSEAHGAKTVESVTVFENTERTVR